MKKLKENIRKPLIAVTLIALIASSVVFAGFTSKNFEIAKNLDIFTTLFRELVINYVDEVNTAELMKTGIDEMLESLDPYTNFIPESEIEDYRFMTTGQYGGIGALIMRRGEYIFISDPYEGFPADKAGLLPGDKILKINDQSAKNRTQEEVSSLLKGQPGTEVVIEVERAGHEVPLIKTLTREVVKINNIPWYGLIDETTGYIKLSSFTQNAVREVRDAFNSLKKDHNIQSIVIDLRGNGGGLLNEAVNITNLFIDKNKVVVETRGKIEERNTTHRTLNNPIDKEIPIVMLVDRSSASASEIVAGAIQDFDRGVIIGQRTFGKGLVQNVVPLSYNTQLKVTIAKYYIPSGRCIQAIDYAQRRENGSVEAIPDSLQVAFKTQAGRTVYDGGGIEPDIFVDPFTLSPISIGLLTQFHIFEYANMFYREHNEIAPAEEFEITDEIYNDFLAFMSQRDFAYMTESEAYINRLQTAAKEERYYAAIDKHIQAIQQDISKTKADDFMVYRAEIEEMLKSEIAGRFYKQKGRVIASLKNDPDILKAIEILNNPENYNAILTP